MTEISSFCVCSVCLLYVDVRENWAKGLERYSEGWE